MVGGLLCLIGGLGGEVFGTGLSVTGVGAAVGVPAIVVSTGLVVGGAANIEAGFQGLLQALKSPGSGGSGSSATPSPGGGLQGQRINHSLKRISATWQEFFGKSQTPSQPLLRCQRRRGMCV
jgi:hypothetical protein